ncbi:MAG: TIGR00282 family metallophosphoesterase [Candidatus Enteromonas sp.]
MNVLFFGDVVGEIGLEALEQHLPRLKKALDADFVIVNGENTCKGSGLTYKEYRRLLALGVDCVTLGNHYHGRDQIDDYIEEAEQLVRPLNLPTYFLGSGSLTFDLGDTSIQVVNLLGQAFMKEEVDSPFEALEDALDPEASVRIVDFHADSTSEKKMLLEAFKGRVSAVIGTHTHVQTADPCIIEGSGFLTDVGYCGMQDGIIGYRPDSILDALLYKKGNRFAIAEDGPTEIDCVLLRIDPLTGKCSSVEPMRFLDGKEFNHVAHHL